MRHHVIKAGGQTPNFQGKTIPEYHQNSFDIVAETERKLEAAQQASSVFIQQDITQPTGSSLLKKPLAFVISQKRNSCDLVQL